jgi:hypothetical protein
LHRILNSTDSANNLEAFTAQCSRNGDPREVIVFNDEHTFRHAHIVLPVSTSVMPSTEDECGEGLARHFRA